MGRRNQRRSVLGLTLVSIWFLFTISLVIWWIYFGLLQVDRILQINHEATSVLVRHQKMLVYEGCTMLFSIIAGGSALLYYIYREMQESRKLQQFFAAFSHQIKTPLASARLKSEILKERIRDPENIKLINKVLTDVGRLSLQLENSLFMADEGRGELFFENIILADIVSSLSDFWPDLIVTCAHDIVVYADRRILDAVIANILQNAVTHGKATEVKIESYIEYPWQVVKCTDNGVGFKGKRSDLGGLFKRHYAGSGSGIGLYIVQQLMHRLGGTVGFPEMQKGFQVAMRFQRDG